MSRDEVVNLVRALFDRSADNRLFLAAKLRDENNESVLEEYRLRIEGEFSATEPPRQPRLGTARKAIRDYHRATGDTDGAAELMLTYVESGNRFSRSHGDMNASYYDSLGIVLRDLGEALRDAPPLYARLRPRLEALRRDSKRVGWSWGTYVAEVVDRLANDLGGD